MKFLVYLAVIGTALSGTQRLIAGEATSEQTFEISLPFASTDIPEWYESHRVGILKAANCEITKPLKESRYAVKTKTPLGDWKYIVGETLEADDSQIKIQYTLAHKMRTDLLKHIVTITIGGAEKGCSVTIKIDQNVDSRLVPAIALRRSQEQSISNVMEYLAKHTGPETRR